MLQSSKSNLEIQTGFLKVTEMNSLSQLLTYGGSAEHSKTRMAHNSP